MGALHVLLVRLFRKGWEGKADGVYFSERDGEGWMGDGD